MNPEPDCVWKISESARSTYTQDGAVVLDIQKGQCYGLNVVAAKAWSTLESRKSGIAFRELIDTLGSTLSVSREQLETDIAEHLQKLEKIGLVHRSDQHQSHALS